MRAHLANPKRPVFDALCLKALYLRNFRNFSEVEVEFSRGLNVFSGDNAQGKTNLLEALYLIATGRSFRTNNLKELILSGEDFFFLEAHIEKDGEEEKICLYFDREKKRLKIGRNEYGFFSPLLGILPFVLHAPEDIEFIKGPPSERRRFLNLHLAQTDPLYVHHLNCYGKSLKQRNAALKSKQLAGIDCWEEKMASSNEYLQRKRAQFLEKLSPSLKERALAMSEGKETYQIEFVPSSGNDYLQKLAKYRKKEMEAGFTFFGAHRDEVLVSMGEKNLSAKAFSSEGQKKTLITALKCAEWDLLSKQTFTKALLGLDDIETHLDEKRKALLPFHFSQFGQVFLTTPRPSSLGGTHFTVQKAKVYKNSM